MTEADQTKTEQESTPATEDSKAEESEPKNDKEKQIRDSIMKDLYNDISSSDDEEESESPIPAAAAPNQEDDETKPEEKAEEEKDEKLIDPKPKHGSGKKNKDKGYTKEQMLKDAEDLEKKKIAKEANEALKELYGDDYEEPNNPFGSQEESKNNLTGKVATRLG